MIRQLCIEAFHLPAETVDKDGPLATAEEFFDDYAPLDSPNFIPFVFPCGPTPTDTLQGYLLVCRVAYVSPGEPVPDLSFDKQTETYMERWFPRKARRSFGRLAYIQMSHPDRIPCELCRSSLSWIDNEFG